MKRGRIKPQDILIVKDGATTGKTSFVADDFPYKEAVLNEHVFRLRVFPEVATQRYVFHFLRGPLGQKMIQDSFRGSAQGGINQSFPDFVHIPLAPIPEQERIVSKLEAELNRLSSSKRAFGRISSILKTFRQSILSKAFRGELTERDPNDEPAERLLERTRQEMLKEEPRVEGKGSAKPQQTDLSTSVGIKLSNCPEGWCWTTIGQGGVCLDHMRVPLNKEERQKRRGNVPYYGANGQVGWVDNYLFDEPLVLVVEDETFIGREKPFSYKITGRSWVNNHAHVLRPTAAVDIDFLNYSLAYYPFTAFTAGTTGRRKLTQKALLSAPYLLPPQAEQRRIVAVVEKHLLKAQEVDASSRAALAHIELLEQVILEQAFIGKLIPQDPNDKPASLLLERIRAQRAAMSKKDKSQKALEFASPAKISSKA
jgi:type I restriction enzyme S subunit